LNQKREKLPAGNDGTREDPKIPSGRWGGVKKIERSSEKPKEGKNRKEAESVPRRGNWGESLNKTKTKKSHSRKIGKRGKQGRAIVPKKEQKIAKHYRFLGGGARLVGAQQKIEALEKTLRGQSRAERTKWIIEKVAKRQTRVGGLPEGGGTKLKSLQGKFLKIAQKTGNKWGGQKRSPKIRAINFKKTWGV